MVELNKYLLIVYPYLCVLRHQQGVHGVLFFLEGPLHACLGLFERTRIGVHPCHTQRVMVMAVVADNAPNHDGARRKTSA